MKKSLSNKIALRRNIKAKSSLNIIFVLLCLNAFIVSCKKDLVYPPSDSYYCQNGSYQSYATSTFDFEKKHLISTSWGGPSFNYIDTFTYSTPVFCPNSNYEIAFSKANAQIPGIAKELIRFNFCDGSQTILANNFYYNLDWGSKGWLIYTGTNHEIFKVKENGDSLISISSTPGYNRAGKLNPSANIYWNERDNELRLEDLNGNLIKIISDLPFGPIDWINDSTLLGWRNNNLYKMEIGSENLTLLNSYWTPSTSSKIYDKYENVCYVFLQNGVGQDDYFLKYSLNGSNSRDTISLFYDSYSYALGECSQDKIITQLSRKSWIDSTLDIKSIRYNIILMNKDGTNEMMINLE